MKRVSFLFGVFLFALASNAQDLIITNSGDSIECRILRISQGEIHFVVHQKNMPVNMSLSMEKVETYNWRYQPTDAGKATRPLRSTNAGHIFVKADGGLSYGLGKIPENVPDNMKEYYRELKLGYNYGAGITYYIDESFGLGLRFSKYLASNSKQNVNFQPITGLWGTGLLKDEIAVTFIGPSISLRPDNGFSNFSYYSDLYIGYISYRNNAIMLDAFRLTGGSIALGTESGLDYDLTNNISVGAQATLTMGILKKVKMEDDGNVTTIKLKKEAYESLYRVDLSFSLRITL